MSEQAQNWVQYLKEALRIFEDAGEEAKLKDDDLDKLENLFSAALSVIEYLKAQRENAYEEAGGADSQGDKNKATHI